MKEKKCQVEEVKEQVQEEVNYNANVNFFGVGRFMDEYEF